MFTSPSAVSSDRSGEFSVQISVLETNEVNRAVQPGMGTIERRKRMERIKEMIKDLNGMLKDAETFYNDTRGAKAAATRLRVGLQDLIKKAKSERVAIMELKKKREA
jgi:hypothetical protein